MSWINAKIIGSNQKRGEAGQERGHKDFIMSRTELVAFAENPAKWIDGGEAKKETKAMAFGSVLDCLATTPDDLLSRFAVSPAKYSSEGMQCPTCKSITDSKKCRECKTDRVPVVVEKDWNLVSDTCKDWVSKQEAQGKSVVSERMLDDVKKAFMQLHDSDESLAELIRVSAKQVLIVAEWRDKETGLTIPFTGLIDLVPPTDNATWGKCLVDIKTTRNGNPATWARVVDDSGYDVQAAIYKDIYCAATNEDRTDFVHIVQENVAPFHVTTPLPALTSEFLEYGRNKYKNALALYAQCLKTNIWPGYPAAGLQFGSVQLISPDELWSYRKSGGVEMAKRIEYEPKREPTDYLA